MKRFLRSRRFFIIAAMLAIGTPVAWLVARTRAPADDSVVARVKRGDFVVTVTNTGELRAPKFVKITGPENAQQADQYQMKIQSILPEGSIVKAGDVVAQLDRSTIAAKLTDVDLALQKADAQYQSTSLDSALNLSKAREDMRTAALTLEEQKLTRDQSQFEAPSVKRQAEIAYEKSLRALRQDSLDLKTKTEQAVAKMREVGTDLTRQKNKLQIVKDVMDGYSVKAPAPGMLIYMKDWNGKKRVAGSQIGAWDPTIATLPDLSQLESVTYVNEIDVRKVAVGQPVTITLDADPTKKLTGIVTTVANAGEQRPNSDAKVFEVSVNVEHPDTTLRPGMTTGNAIQTLTVKNALHIPLEAVMNEQGITFTYRRVGSHVVKQEVEIGAANDDEVVVTNGLQADDRVLLSAPRNHDKLPLVRLPGSKPAAKAPGGDTGTGQQPVPIKPDTQHKADSNKPAPAAVTPTKKG